MKILLRESEEVIRALLLAEKIGTKEVYRAQAMRVRIGEFLNKV
jgi:hypothetical protein